MGAALLCIGIFLIKKTPPFEFHYRYDPKLNAFENSVQLKVERTYQYYPKQPTDRGEQK